MLDERMPCDDAVWFLNGRITFHRSAAAGPDEVCITEQHLPQGDSPPLHRHAREDEVFHILEGALRLRIGETEVLAHAGETLVAPKGVPHSFRVESKEARFLTITVGRDFETMVREMSRPAGDGLPRITEPSDELRAALTEACARNNIEILGPPLAA